MQNYKSNLITIHTTTPIDSSLAGHEKLMHIIFDSAYVLLGSFALLGNAVVFAVFLWSAALRSRKEILLLIALASADFLYGIAIVAVGGRRLWIVISDLSYSFEQ